MSIYLRNNIWWVNLYRPGMPDLQVSTGCRSKADAMAVEATLRRATRGDVTRDRLIAALDNALGRDTDQGAGSVPIGLAWETYLASVARQKISAGTAAIRRQRLAHFAGWVSHHWPQANTMAQVSRQCAMAYLDSLRASGVTGKTYNNARGDLSTVWSTLMIRAELAENVWKVVPTAPTQDSRQRRAFSLEEEQRILAACEAFPPWGPVCIVARYTGLRKSDVMFLRWSDIDGDCLRLTPAKTIRHKTKVVIPLHTRILAVLKTLPRDDEWLFPDLAGKGLRARRNFGQILKAAGVADPDHILDFHCWRHTFRTRLRDAGVSEKLCNELGGWSEAGAGDRYDHSLEPLRAAIAADK